MGKDLERFLDARMGAIGCGEVAAATLEGHPGVVDHDQRCFSVDPVRPGKELEGFIWNANV
jgi:hypothetical protein